MAFVGPIGRLLEVLCAVNDFMLSLCRLGAELWYGGRLKDKSQQRFTQTRVNTDRMNHTAPSTGYCLLWPDTVGCTVSAEMLEYCSGRQLPRATVLLNRNTWSGLFRQVGCLQNGENDSLWQQQPKTRATQIIHWRIWIHYRGDRSQIAVHI